MARTPEEREEAARIKAEQEAVSLKRRLVLATSPIDPDKMMFERIDTTAKLPDNRDAPLFSVAEVSRCFFGRSPHWLRWLEREGKLVLGKRKKRPVGTRRTAASARCYSLGDIELVAHALYEQKAIDSSQLLLALTNARNTAVLWGILT